jgi:hypothetical protein
VPLEFESINHGRIAFGLFNIETDMILLNHYFLFAKDFNPSPHPSPHGRERGMVRDELLLSHVSQF